MIENSEVDEIKNGEKGIPLIKDGPSDHCEYKSSVSTKTVSRNSKILDWKMGSLRSNFLRLKIFCKKNSILDSEMGTLRNNFSRIKVFFKDVFCYIRSFFTKKKINEVRAIFSYKKTSSGQTKIHGPIPLNSINKKK